MINKKSPTVTPNLVEQIVTPSLLPFYQDESVTIYCGDCRFILPLISEAAICITSPPYNMGGKNLGYQPLSKVGQNYYGEYLDNLMDSEYKEFIFDVINLCLLKTKFTFWNMQMLSNNKNTVIELMMQYKGQFKDLFIWKKQAVSQIPVKGYRAMASGFEMVFCLGKDNSRIFKDVNFPENGYVPNIMEWFKTETFPEHHATFPLELPKYFIQHFSKEGETVIDPFGGVGTTGRAAKDLGRKCILIEREEKYCEISANRMAQEVLCL